MSEINFLSDEKEEIKKEKRGPNRGKFIKWSGTELEKAAQGKNLLQKKPGIMSRLFSFLKSGNEESAQSKSQSKTILNDVKNKKISDDSRIVDNIPSPKKVDSNLLSRQTSGKNMPADTMIDKTDKSSDKKINPPYAKVDSKDLKESKDFYGKGDKSAYNQEKKFEKSNVLETNLMEGELVYFFDWKKNLTFLLINLIAVTVFIVLAYMALRIYEYSELKAKEISIKEEISLLEKINQRTSQVASSEKDLEEIYLFGRKLEFLSYLLDNHIHWTNFFNFLEKNTLSDIHYTQFGGDISGSYSLPAKSSDYSSINKQIEQLRNNEMVKEIKFYSATLGAAGGNDKDEVSKKIVDFNLDLIINPEIFKNATGNKTN